MKSISFRIKKSDVAGSVFMKMKINNFELRIHKTF